MHRRFAGARRAALGCPAGEISAVVAEGFRLRLIGLMSLEEEEIEPLLFERCRSIHTHGMRTRIDLVWLALDAERGRVTGVVMDLEPRRHARAPRGRGLRRSSAALELPAGEAERLGLSAGAELTIA